jgi:hypothetical protein
MPLGRAYEVPVARPRIENDKAAAVKTETPIEARAKHDVDASI